MLCLENPRQFTDRYLFWSESTKSPQIHTDLELRCADGMVYAHKAIIEMLCPSLRYLFKVAGAADWPPQTTTTTTCIFPEFEVSTMRKLLQILYTGATCFENMADLDKLSSLSEVMLGFSIFELSKKTGESSRVKGEDELRDEKPPRPSSSDLNTGVRRQELGECFDKTVNDIATGNGVGDSNLLILDIDCVKHEPVDVDESLTMVSRNDDDDVAEPVDVCSNVADRDASVASSSPGRRYTCQKCDVSFGLLQHLRVHIRRAHLSGKPFKNFDSKQKVLKPFCIDQGFKSFKVSAKKTTSISGNRKSMASQKKAPGIPVSNPMTPQNTSPGCPIFKPTTSQQKSLGSPVRKPMTSSSVMEVGTPAGQPMTSHQTPIIESMTSSEIHFGFSSEQRPTTSPRTSASESMTSSDGLSDFPPGPPMTSSDVQQILSSLASSKAQDRFKRRMGEKAVSVCPVCSKSFTIYSNLRRHIRSAHLNIRRPDLIKKKSSEPPQMIDFKQ